jgi:hypothetical protein
LFPTVVSLYAANCPPTSKSSAWNVPGTGAGVPPNGVLEGVGFEGVDAVSRNQFKLPLDPTLSKMTRMTC